MKKSKVLLSLLMLGAVLFIGGLALWPRSGQGEGTKPTNATVFFHGYGSSRNAEKTMSQYLVKKKYSSQIINVTVSKNGEVHFSDQAQRGKKNPLYLVQFNDNRNVNYAKTNQWVTSIMRQIHQQGIHSVNLIGHSMGNMAIVYYLKNHVQPSDQLPSVKKEIDIAGHFNSLGADPAAQSEVDEAGKPSIQSSSYQALSGLSAYYQHNQTKVLNIFGNSTGASHSDGTVPNNSSKTLRSFVTAPSQYEEKLLTGKDAQHSRLHENQQVNQLLFDFLTTN
ncbi:alpha/beta hydrolase [Fructobacillus sp. M1-13]|nr:alpha/beta hydrolase [Fructobacillus papyriferae]MCD2158680.1 alpha/beta hydrolase [Fructobacillus papyriferae]